MEKVQDLWGLDGGRFRVQDRSDYEFGANGTTSGAWADGELGFIQLFSGPADFCWPTITMAFGTEIRTTERLGNSSGQLSIGKAVRYAQHDFSVADELTVMAVEVDGYVVWGFNDKDAASVRDLIQSADTIERRGQSVVVVPPSDGSWQFVGQESSVVATAPNVMIANFERREDSERVASLRVSKGARVPAGRLFASSRTGIDPELLLISDTAVAELKPIGTQSPNEVLQRVALKIDEFAHDTGRAA